MELIPPYGGKLVSLVAEGEEKSELARRAVELPSLQLTARTLCDLELLATGAFSPLDRFMGQADAERVAAEMRLAGGTLFPIPVTLQADQTDGIAGKEIALRTSKNNLIGWMKVEEVYEWSWPAEAQQVFGTIDGQHPLVAEMRTWGRYRLSGPLRVLELPGHPDFPSLRRTPAEVRARLASMGRRNVVAFQPGSPIHRAHEEMIRRAVREVEGSLLIQPVVGMAQPGDIGHYTRVRTYQALVENHDDPSRTVLNLLPLATRLAGPREALWHAIVQRNFGASHLLVEDDQARELAALYTPEIGVQAMPSGEMVYLPDEDRYELATALPSNAQTLSLSETQVREEYLAKGKPLPEWFTRKEIRAILLDSYPPRDRQGKEHRGGGPDRDADGAWPPGDHAGRGRGADPLVQRAELLQRRPRHEHSAGGLCGVGDRAPQRRGDLRGGQSLPSHPRPGARHGYEPIARRRCLHRGIRRYAR
jgi:sulfate adenylyltransferase